MVFRTLLLNSRKTDRDPLCPIASSWSVWRRGLAAFALSAVCALTASAQETNLTARQVIDRIQKNVGVPWRSETVDTFKAGDPDTPVTGIAVTMMATYEVLQKAAASGKNLIITHEPTFYSHLDRTDELTNDPVFQAKEAFIKEHHLVVWRFHDHWHAHPPDGIQVGMIRALGWEKYQTPENNHLFVLPSTRLENLAADVKKRLNVRTLRVVGDPGMKVTKAALIPGAAGPATHRRALERDDVEVLLIGEVPEWETIEYVADATAEGKHKALILIGHIPSEQAGMEECARWLKTFITETPVEFVAASEPFWQPQ
jgi:putative NIF3 family GTP cyclohydrolase 1 type 2